MEDKLQKNKTLRSKAYEEIKNKIIYFVLKPGEKIFEGEIAKDLKMSRTPVREALLMLENERLVECHPKLGFLVKKLTPKEVEEYFALRMAFEDFAAPFIIERITPTEIEALKRNVAEAEESVKKNELPGIIRCETEFHTILYRATKSDVFFHTISGLVDKFQWLRAMGLSAPEGARISLDGHKEILIAIEERDEESFKMLLRKHMQHGREKFEYMKVLLF